MAQESNMTDLIFDHVKFIGNVGRSGSAVDIYCTNTLFDSVLFESNVANTLYEGGATNFEFVRGYPRTVTIRDSTFRNNWVYVTGAAVWARCEGQDLCPYTSSLVLQNVVLEHNTGTRTMQL